ncbi:UNVERIFIED_CONTAM: hypothetical protein K2H54_053619 [Gekko kuhli]
MKKRLCNYVRAAKSTKSPVGLLRGTWALWLLMEVRAMSSGAEAACHMARPCQMLFMPVLRVLEDSVIFARIVLLFLACTGTSRWTNASGKVLNVGGGGYTLRLTHAHAHARTQAKEQESMPFPSEKSGWANHKYMSAERTSPVNEWHFKVGTPISSKQFTVDFNNRLMIVCVSYGTLLFAPKHTPFAGATKGAAGFELTHSSSAEEIRNLHSI